MTISKIEIMHHHGDLLQWAAQGNQAAVDILVDALFIANIWDALIDRDRPVSDPEVNQVFYTALVKLPRNPFFRQHADRLIDFTERCLAEWLVATSWERGTMTLQQAEIAYISRGSYTGFITEVALIVGGIDHAIDVAERVRLTFHHEGVTGYIQALEREKEARHG